MLFFSHFTKNANPVVVRPQKRKLFHNKDLNDPLKLCKFIGTFPFNISYDRLTFSRWYAFIMITYCVLLLGTEFIYISTYPAASRHGYRFVIHVLEFVLGTTCNIAMTWTVLGYKFSPILQAINEIQSQLQELSPREFPKAFSYSSARKTLHLSPLIVIIVGDILSTGMSHVEVVLSFVHYYRNIRLFAFFLLYSIFVSWLEHVLDSLIAIYSKSSLSLMAKKVEITCRIEDTLLFLSDRINVIFAPALLALMVKSFIITSNNIYWALMMRREQVRVIQIAWVTLFISHVLVGFRSAESCRKKVNLAQSWVNGPIIISNNIYWALTMRREQVRVIQMAWVTLFISHVLLGSCSAESCRKKAIEWDWIFYRRLKTDSENCVENPRIFLHFIRRKKVYFTVAGFFDMGYSFLGKMIVGSLTFVVLIPQILSPFAKPVESDNNSDRRQL